MSFLLAALWFFQAGVRGDIIELRQYLGGTYPATIERLNLKNRILLGNTEPLAPLQAAQMRAQMQVPDKLPANPIVSARIQNVGQGLLTFLFEDDFIVEQVNFVFCPAQADPPRPERVIALQVLFDDSRALGSTLNLLQTVYQMPKPIVPPRDYMPQLMYPIAANLPVTIWDLNGVEGVYQPISGKLLITGQLWLTDKAGVMACPAIPSLPLVR